jgi:RNA polymerase sigma-70 factor, ECF subfamily
MRSIHLPVINEHCTQLAPLLHSNVHLPSPPSFEPDDIHADMTPITSATAPTTQANRTDTFAEDMRLVAEDRDKNAYARIFRHFAPRLKDFSLRQVGNEQQAMELVQETMLLVWKKAHLYDPAIATTTTWIYRISRNLRFDMLRKQMQLKDEVSADDLWPEFVDPATEADHDHLDQQLAAEQVLRYYRELPPAQKEIVSKLYLEEKSHQEVADELGIPLGTVKSRVRLAINRLRQYVSHD